MSSRETLSTAIDTPADSPRAVQMANRTPLFGGPMRLTFLLSLLCLTLLQCWRPLYHLTDDNLTAWLPQFVEFSQRLWSGRNPFVTEHLFGGHYDYLHDAGVVSFLGPYLLLCTPLGASRWAHLAPDIVASLNLLTIALAFCWSGRRLRDLQKLSVSDGMLVFLSLSYAFSPFNLVVNPSWLGFINPQAAMPVIVVAWFEPSHRRALALIAGAMLFALLGAHLHPFIYMNLFMGLLALVLCRQQRSWNPLLRLAGGAAIALLIASPALIPAATGFSSSTRSQGVSFAGAALSRVPLLHLAASFSLGPAATTFLPAIRVHSADPTYSVAIAFSLANIPLVWAFARKRKWSFFEVGILGLVACTALLIVRPNWLQDAMLHVPLLRSLRWPFREIANLLFFIHLLALWNLGSFGDRRTRPALVIGFASFAVVLLAPAPTFNPMYVDRSLILSGRTAEHWDRMRARFGPNLRVIVGTHPQLTFGSQMRLAPFSLMGGYNYAAMFGFVYMSGYSPTEADSAGASKRPFHFGGLYTYPVAEEIWQETPGSTLIEYIRNGPAVLRVRHEKEVFYIIYDELTHQITETDSAEILKTLPPAEPFRGDRWPTPRELTASSGTSNR